MLIKVHNRILKDFTNYILNWKSIVYSVYDKYKIYMLQNVQYIRNKINDIILKICLKYKIF